MVIFRVKQHFTLLQLMWSWIYFWVKSLIIALYHWVQRLQFTNAKGKEYSRRLSMWKESAVCPPDYECSTVTCGQSIKKCYLKIYINPFGEIFSKFMKTFKTIILITVCVLFQSLFLLLWSMSFWWAFWDGIKSWDSAVCSLQWPRQRFWQGCYRTVVDPQHAYS